ncbi:unnamed protein product [Effrenium voratum]|nr:unnamed protein product [Effrenium voratum]
MHDVYIHARENSHRPRSYIGWCEGLSAGNHKAEVVVSTTPGYSNCDCYTGWHPAGAHYLLEAEEIPKHYKMVHYVRSTKQNGEDKGYLPNHKLSFTKQHSDTRLRLFYSDNLRTLSAHHHCVCHWEIHVDGKKCPSVEIFGQVYVTRLHHPTYEDTNPHRPRSFAGFCDDVAEGDHSAQIHLKAVGPACDCYTGWKDSPAKKGSAGTLEVHEFWRPCSEGTSEGACKKPKCYWNTKEKKCLDLVECPGSDKVAVGTDCRCGEEEAAKGKYCYEDKTVNEGAKAEKTEKSGALLASAAGIPLLSLALAF